MFFWLFISILVLQRLVELSIAKKNENWMKEQGAIEFGKSHYPWMVLMHIGFLSSLILEVMLNRFVTAPLWPVWLAIFILAQACRIWVIISLGKFWNTKIIVLPESDITAKGPYKYMKHPNYLVVAVEIIVISLLFDAFITGILFTLLNLWMMAVRIPEEENALGNLTRYNTIFQQKSEK
ncbi:isoprenylcysteine carboxyl methyltransferase family protein [Peribacillus glennii]|uniref:isoprenylcysteine carboxyl methyltransferase family protein n=1 Tax=Peribacillus glennii TaxID=2303991 RepID=UPI002682DA8F|nr:isoprenylcysteine carboxylmethyltransferase family protein [Peribacillus glennii]